MGVDFRNMSMKHCLQQREKLIKLEDHQNSIWESHNKPEKTGIECPNCQTELIYPDNVILCSYPAQRRVACEKCGQTQLIYIK